MQIRNSLPFIGQQDRTIKGNRFLIKSLSNNKFLRYDKNFETLQFDFLEDIQNINDYTWIISSFDQDNAQMYQLRFGELIEITYSKKNYPLTLDKIPFLIEFYNNNINQQTFASIEDTLLQNQPCLLKNIFTNTYLNIQNGKACWNEKKVIIQNCFQLILVPGEQTYERIQKHPRIANATNIIIRNYRTGHYLFTKKEFGITINGNQMLFAQPYTKKRQVDKWQLNYDVTSKTLEYQLFHVETQSFAQNLTTQNNKNDNKLYLDLSHVKPQQFWNVLTIDRQPITFGIPFLIQNSTNLYFLTQNVKQQPNQQVHEVIIQPDLTNDSLWVIFEHQ